VEGDVRLPNLRLHGGRGRGGGEVEGRSRSKIDSRATGFKFWMILMYRCGCRFSALFSGGLSLLCVGAVVVSVYANATLLPRSVRCCQWETDLEWTVRLKKRDTGNLEWSKRLCSLCWRTAGSVDLSG
jgi:hypothetical protein